MTTDPAAILAGTETIHDGWGKLYRVVAALPDGSEVAREVEHHGDAAGVLAYDPTRRVALLVRQVRVAMLLAGSPPETLEIVAGILDEADPRLCAIREADEEAGVRLERLEPIGTFQTMPGISTERMHLFLAEYTEADRVGPGGGLAHEAEATVPVELPLRELAAMADRGEFVDAKSVIALLTLRLRRPDLFTA